MRIDYKQQSMILEFDAAINFPMPLSFLLRSIIGKELKYISCVLRLKLCTECPLSEKCAYSVIFERPINKQSLQLNGRANSSPPYIINAPHNIRTAIKRVEINMTIIGKAIEYSPYLLLALQRAGEQGIFKDRLKYKIDLVKSNNIEYSFKDFITQKSNPETYQFTDNSTKTSKKLNIRFLSPFRYKKDGKYQKNITHKDILISSVRRLNILSEFYGDNTQISYLDEDMDIIHKNIYWHDDSRYSVRQRTEMKLGGVLGEMILSGNLSDSTLSILQGATLFNIGKNISFGLGNILITEDI